MAGGEDPELRLEDVLAARLRISRDLFLDVFGAGWAKQEQQNRDWPFQPDRQPWYVAGTPAQLMLQIDDGIATVARPVGRWQGVAELVYEPTGSVVLAGDPEADRKVIAGLLAARRSSFRYCPLCREQTPPELRDGGLECMSCGERWRGILH
ncbi:hypothetical protein Kisp01_69070 [Kineosporia sp. NBRC 101677]|uniref:hypothetical protein n=1 Tax=Kineosporia sp. NBRC 101677 TaxID=3032197 RepID=UPI0024A3D9B9|nr:hypothetical protein [Kineosporia sp. NBRC 101677]GLY19893.1 hypothetical protein Kisp01_69070 [Kineosporia sp. NBRC 101677]